MQACERTRGISERKRPEILAPAGSMEGLRAAIAAGCDAVYMGGSRFGARAYAQNPEQDGMLEAIRYCHRYGKKLYLTVNTLLREEELQGQLYQYISPYYEIGLDVAIVQDVGVMRFLHREFPGLELHASTQMTLTMGVDEKILKPYGVTRIVPARELTLEELGIMRQQTDLELEIFVHGALCYCYSGQCLFSSMLGGRSGNRGRCAQPCRLPYQLAGKGKQAREQYLLSPKENNALSYIGELIEAGMDSFKIEGRMKKPEYTAFTTYIYRKYTDLYLELGQEGYRQYLQEHSREWEEDRRRLGELYNRSGFTQGYLEGAAGVPLKKKGQEKGSMLSHLRPRHGGILAGRVVQAGKRQAAYETALPLHAQDIVEFRNGRQQTLYEYTIGEDRPAHCQISCRILPGSNIRAGDLVYRTRDARLLSWIRENLLPQPPLPVDACFTAKEGKPMLLELTYGQPGEGTLFSAAVSGGVCQRAEKQPADRDSVRKYLQQTGDTPFVMESCRIDLGENLFLPVGEIKRLRRQGFVQLQEKLELAGARKRQEERKEDWEKKAGRGKPEPDPGKALAEGTERPAELEDVTRSVAVASWDQLEQTLSVPWVQLVYVKMDLLGRQELEAAVERILAAGKRAGLAMPYIFREGVYQAEKEEAGGALSLYRDPRLSAFLVRNMESWIFLTDVAGVHPGRIVLDSQMYVMNREAAAFWQEQGCGRITFPLELTGEEWGRLSAGRTAWPWQEAVCYGHIPLMVSAQCVSFNTEGCHGKGGGQTLIRDGKGREFIVYNVCKYCYNLIYQKEPLCLLEERERLQSMGISRFRYDFTIESAEETARALAGDVRGHKGHFYTGIE